MKRVRVIFLHNVPGQGRVGDVRDVAAAFAKNVLFPKKLAEIATDQRVAKLRNEEQKKQQQTSKTLQEDRAMLARLAKTTLTLHAKSNAQGALYGSIQSGPLLAALHKSGFSSLTERSIRMETTLDHIGTFSFSIHYKQEPPVKVTVIIESETI